MKMFLNIQEYTFYVLRFSKFWVAAVVFYDGKFGKGYSLKLYMNIESSIVV